MTTRSELDRKLIAAVERLGRALRVARQDIATQLQISLLQLQIIEHLDALGPRRVGLLANELDVTTPTISDALAVLHDKGIVERTPDPDDGRASLTALSNAGTRIAAQARDALVPVLQDVRVASDEDTATALSVVLGEIHRLQLAGVISINRSCLSCSHYQPPLADRTGRCLLLQMELRPADVRVDCSEHQTAR